MKATRIYPHRLFWNKVIAKIEHETFKAGKGDFIRSMDYSVTLPASLRKEIEEIVPSALEKDSEIAFLKVESSRTESASEFSGFDDDISIDEDKTVHQRQRKEEKQLMASIIKQQKELEFSESKCSVVNRIEIEYPSYEVRIDKPVDVSSFPQEKEEFNWMAEYLCKSRNDRVVWNSQLYPSRSVFLSKSLEKQADHIMDTCSKRFADWINSLSTDRNKDIPRDLVKTLFAIQPEPTLYNSVKSDPTEVKAIAKQIAETWNVPEMALETKYDRTIKNRWFYRPKKVIRHAFGRTIPQRELPWVPSYSQKPIKTFFPNELLTGELMFKGIGHLRSTKKFIDFCRRNKFVEKPSFLVKCGYFRKRRKESTASGQPLYDRLNLKY